MKRFDKGYIYYSLLADLFSSFVVVFFFLGDLLENEESNLNDIIPVIPILVGAYALVYLCFITYRVLYYRSSGYELTGTEIKCKRGVLFRKNSVLDYNRIHAINKKQNLIHRLFGIAILTVDSGSANTSHQAEITIIEKEKTVDALIGELNALKDGGSCSAQKTEEEVLLSSDDSLYRFTSKRKMLYTLINIASTSFFTALFGMLSVIVIGICKMVLQLDFLGTFGEYLLVAVLITVGATLALSAFVFIGCMIHSFIGYYNFTITKRDNSILISYGLLEKHTNAFGYDRIKAVKISQGLVQRILGFATIKLEVIGYTHESDDKDESLGVLVPFCKYDEIGEILGRLLPDYVPDKKQTGAVSYFPFVSWFCLILGTVISVVLLCTLLPLLILDVPSIAVAAVAFAIIGAGIIIAGIKCVSAFLAYKNNGIAKNDGRITAYYGGFTRNITVFMADNLVAVENVTTPLRAKSGIASIVMHLKTNEQSNEIKVHIQRDSLSNELEGSLTL